MNILGGMEFCGYYGVACVGGTTYKMDSFVRVRKKIHFCAFKKTTPIIIILIHIKKIPYLKNQHI